MNANDRRTTGQPDDGLTTMQIFLWLAGSLLCMAAAAFSVFVIAPLGFAVIATVAFSLGYFVSSDKQLNDNRNRGADIDSSIKVLTAVQVCYFGGLLLIWLVGKPERQFPSDVVTFGLPCLHLYCLAFITGRFKRACGRFYSL